MFLCNNNICHLLVKIWRANNTVSFPPSKTYPDCPLQSYCPPRLIDAMWALSSEINSGTLVFQHWGSGAPSENKSLSFKMALNQILLRDILTNPGEYCIKRMILGPFGGGSLKSLKGQFLDGCPLPYLMRGSWLWRLYVAGERKTNPHPPIWCLWSQNCSNPSQNWGNLTEKQATLPGGTNNGSLFCQS